MQLHLHGLPEDIIVKVITDFVEERNAPERPVNNYADWLLASFGKTFAELFPMQYTRKYHLTTAENMSTDWLGPRIYRPSLEEVLRGALSASAPDSPLHHAFPLSQRGRIRLVSEEVRADGKHQAQSSSWSPSIRVSGELTFSNGVVTAVRRAGLVGAAAGSDSR